jgi:hypothetical protein
MRLTYDLHDIQRSVRRIPVEALRPKLHSDCDLGEGYQNHKECSDSIDLVKESSSAPVIDATNKGSSEQPRIAAENLGIVGERRAGIARVLKILRQCLRLGRRIFIGVASRLRPRAPQL